MQQIISRRLVRKRRWDHDPARYCVCYECGAAVFPLPLRANPAVQVPRAYARSVTIRGKRTGNLESYAILFCPACADPEDVQDAVQFEPAATHDASAHAARRSIVERTCYFRAVCCADALECVMMRIMENSAMS